MLDFMSITPVCLPSMHMRRLGARNAVPPHGDSVPVPQEQPLFASYSQKCRHSLAQSKILEALNMMPATVERVGTG